MTQHKHSAPVSVQVFDIRQSQSFSCFSFIETHFEPVTSIQRSFSLARSLGAQTMVLEEIPAEGFIHEENEELLKLFPDYRMANLLRISFWNIHFREKDEIKNQADNKLVGYLILKQDIVPSKRFSQWHVFEAVFLKYQHPHNCIPNIRRHSISINEHPITIDGILYCQQNTLNKTCGQVAVRSLLSSILPEGDISYSSINMIAQSVNTNDIFTPSKGLDVQHIRQILRHFDLKFHDIDYIEAAKSDKNIRTEMPYQKFLYAGIESGYGGLLGFDVIDPTKDTPQYHIIPFYGHTFNKDTWTPHAEQSYFNIENSVGYIPSESWTSSFIGHDDNFGPNFCVPRLYVKPENATYVLEILKHGAVYSGLVAEAMALPFLYSLYNIFSPGNEWLERLRIYSDPENHMVVLRAICMSKGEYFKHLYSISDWDHNTEAPIISDLLYDDLPEQLWVVEVSIPHLFPANERKLGEIILDATSAPNDSKDIDYSLFVLARVPEEYYLVESDGTAPSFRTFPSKLVSHTSVYQQHGAH